MLNTVFQRICLLEFFFWLLVSVLEYDNKLLFPKLNSTQFINRNVKILNRTLYSPSLKNVGWIEDAQLICQRFVCIFFPAPVPSLQTNVWKITF